MTDASRAFCRALVAAAAAAGCATAIARADARDWASATFTGQRHRLSLDAHDDRALAAWLELLPEAEWHLPGHIVASVDVERCDGTVVVTALTLHDR